MNSVCLTGRLTRKPEQFKAQNGTEIAKFTIAVDRGDKDKNTDFPYITAFGKVAEAVNKYLDKGRLVAVHGKIQTGGYKDKDGNTVYTTDVVADVVQFLDSKKD